LGFVFPCFFVLLVKNLRKGGRGRGGVARVEVEIREREKNLVFLFYIFFAFLRCASSESLQPRPADCSGLVFVVLGDRGRRSGSGGDRSLCCCCCRCRRRFCCFCFGRCRRRRRSGSSGRRTGSGLARRPVPRSQHAPESLLELLELPSDCLKLRRRGGGGGRTRRDDERAKAPERREWEGSSSPVARASASSAPRRGGEHHWEDGDPPQGPGRGPRGQEDRHRWRSLRESVCCRTRRRSARGAEGELRPGGKALRVRGSSSSSSRVGSTGCGGGVSVSPVPQDAPGRMSSSGTGNSSSVAVDVRVCSSPRRRRRSSSGGGSSGLGGPRPLPGQDRRPADGTRLLPLEPGTQAAEVEGVAAGEGLGARGGGGGRRGRRRGRRRRRRGCCRSVAFAATGGSSGSCCSRRGSCRCRPFRADRRSSSRGSRGGAHVLPADDAHPAAPRQVLRRRVLEPRVQRRRRPPELQKGPDPRPERAGGPPEVSHQVQRQAVRRRHGGKEGRVHQEVREIGRELEVEGRGAAALPAPREQEAVCERERGAGTRPRSGRGQDHALEREQHCDAVRPEQGRVHREAEGERVEQQEEEQQGGEAERGAQGDEAGEEASLSSRSTLASSVSSSSSSSLFFEPGSGARIRLQVRHPVGGQPVQHLGRGQKDKAGGGHGARVGAEDGHRQCRLHRRRDEPVRHALGLCLSQPARQEEARGRPV